MSETIQVEKPEIVVDRTEVPLNICMETGGKISSQAYYGNMAVKVGQVAIVKDAP